MPVQSRDSHKRHERGTTGDSHKRHKNTKGIQLAIAIHRRNRFGFIIAVSLSTTAIAVHRRDRPPCLSEDTRGKTQDRHHADRMRPRSRTRRGEDGKGTHGWRGGGVEVAHGAVGWRGWGHAHGGERMGRARTGGWAAAWRSHTGRLGGAEGHARVARWQGG